MSIDHFTHELNANLSLILPVILLKKCASLFTSHSGSYERRISKAKRVRASSKSSKLLTYRWLCCNANSLFAFMTQGTFPYQHYSSRRQQKKELSLAIFLYLPCCWLSDTCCWKCSLCAFGLRDRCLILHGCSSYFCPNSFVSWSASDRQLSWPWLTLFVLMLTSLSTLAPLLGIICRDPAWNPSVCQSLCSNRWASKRLWRQSVHTVATCLRCLVTNGQKGWQKG